MSSLAQTIQVQAPAAMAGLLLAAWLGLRLRNWLRRQMQGPTLVERIDRLLPQTQCRLCGYSGCRPYAGAISRGDAINKCPPGGERTITRLAALLNEPPQRLDPGHGRTAPGQVAVIRATECIGCTRCLAPCPVDAIIGGPQLLHTVIAAECTGCGLCLAPCPVDCIELQTTSHRERVSRP